MPVVRVNQLVGKSLTLKKAIPFYRVNDINNKGDNAKPVGNMLPIGYQLRVDSFLTKGPQFVDKYGFVKAKRSDDYLTFFGKDGNNYAIKTQSISVGQKGLKESGVKTVEQEVKEAEEAQKSDLEKLFGGVGKYAKWLIIGIAAVWATGYLIKSTKK
jgi:hypothetical protein